MSPTASAVSPASSSPLRCTASTTRSPLSVTMPGKTRSRRSSAERGGTTTSATPEPRVSSVPASSSSAYWSTSVRAWSLKSREIDARRPVGSSRSPKSTTIAIVPATSGTPTSANAKKPKLPDARRRPRRSETITLTGEPGEREQRPGMRGERERHQQLGRRAAAAARPSRPTTGSSAATAPLTLISAVSTATSSIIRTSSRVRLSPTRAIELAARPRRSRPVASRPR